MGQKKPLGVSQSSNAINRKIETSLIGMQQANLLNQNKLNIGGQNKTNQMNSSSIQTPLNEQNTINTQQNINIQGNLNGNKQIKSNVSSVENQMIPYDSAIIINNQYDNCQQLIKVTSLSCNIPSNRFKPHQKHYFKKNKLNNIPPIGNSLMTNPSVKQINSNSLLPQNLKSEQDLFDTIDLQNINQQSQQILSKKLPSQLLDLEEIQASLSKNSKIYMQQPPKSQSLVLQAPYLQSMMEQKKNKQKQLELLPEFLFSQNYNIYGANFRYFHTQQSTVNSHNKQNILSENKVEGKQQKLINAQQPLQQKQSEKNRQLESNVQVDKLQLNPTNILTASAMILQPIKNNDQQRQQMQQKLPTNNNTQESLKL